MAEITKPQDTKQPISPGGGRKGRAGQRARGADAAVAPRSAERRPSRSAVPPAMRSARMPRRAPTSRVATPTPVPRRCAAPATPRARRRAGAAQAVAESQRRIVQDAAERFEEVSRKIAEATQGTTENVRRLIALPNAAEGGLRDLQQGVVGLVEGVVQTNLRVAQELFRLSNPAPFVELQQRFVREYTDTLVRNSATLVRAVRRTADETLRPLEEQLAQQRYQTAAE